MRPTNRPLALSTLLCCLLLAGCPTDDPRYCAQDSECPAKVESGAYTDSDDGDGFVLARDKTYCHPGKHYCYAGCKSDADCQCVDADCSADANKRMNKGEAPGRRCNPRTHHCEKPSDGGGGDLPMNLPLGAACQLEAQCQSGHCADGRCCAVACTGPCLSCALAGSEGQCKQVPAGQDPRGDCKGDEPACAGTCNGGGQCSFAAAGTICGSPACQQGSLKTCDGLGRCQAGGKGCNGFTCTLAGEACKTSCTDKTEDCMPGFECAGGACQANLPLGAPCYGNDKACASGFCTDQVCCEKQSCGECWVCGSSGTCEKRPAGPAPAGQCGGDPACGGGQCDGNGNCAYKPASTLCTQSCALPSGETTTACTDTHTCGPPKTTSCGFYACDAAGKACLASCATHASCIAGSVCDRSLAHQSGGGTCIDPAKVVTLSAGQKIQDAIASLGSKTHIRTALNGLYLESVTISSNSNVTLIGDGPSVILKPPTGSGVFILGDKASFTLQGVTVTGATGAGHGLYCNAPSSASTLTVVESTIEQNAGIGLTATSCNVNLHRATVRNNSGGGVELNKGVAKITDSVIANNGTKDVSPLGGVSLAAATSVTFINNTVVNNQAASTKAGGVICSGGETLRNSILAGNSGASQFGLCAFDHTSISDPAPATLPAGAIGESCSLVSFKPAASSKCINSGTNTGASALDRDSTARIKGGTVDLGAYEVQ